MARDGSESEAERVTAARGLASGVGAALLAVGVTARIFASLRRRVNRLQLRDTTSAGEGLTPADVLLGGSALAGMYEPISDEDVFLVLKEALDLGVRGVDTAPHYGLGISEERIGSFFRQLRQIPNSLSARAQDVRVYTKVGRLIRLRSEVGKTVDPVHVQWDNAFDSDDCIFKGIPEDRVSVADYSAEGAASSHRESSDRLEGCEVHGLRVHDCETDFLLEQTLGEGGALEGIARLKREGKISSVGIGVNDPEYALRVLQSPRGKDVDCVMIAGSWNLLDQSAYSLLLHCQRSGVEVHNAGVFASGLIVGGNTVRYQPAQRAMIDKARRWRVLCQRHDCKIAEVALAFAFLPKCVKKIAVGVKTVGELRESLQAAGRPVLRELWQDARREGLIVPGLKF
mmetsp:Transcript_779/g.3020  ORF Transcript_779/g.3020 Transcript_779/m.3020 type:complete len:400 (+) Transcript_779:234-1433(+)